MAPAKVVAPEIKSLEERLYSLAELTELARTYAWHVDDDSLRGFIAWMEK